jgi:Zn-dependent protease/predicted transcriptional regulator
MKASIKLFRIAGIDIGIHYSWIFIFLLFTWTLAVGYFPVQFTGLSTATYWLAGAITSLMIFVSVLIHELTHSIIARARGIPVNSITLFILGGVSNLEEEPQKAGAEFVMAIAGPASSIVLAGIFWGIARWIGGATTTNLVIGGLAYLGIINLYLGIFNLLPGFPLDGGRVFRSIIWGATGDLKKATNIASVVGQVIGWLFIAVGVFVMISSGNMFNGLWLAFIGWFLNSSADASRKEITLRERLSHVKVRDVMNRKNSTVSPEVTVQELVTGMFGQQHDRAVPVCRNDQLAGIVTIADIKKVPQAKWAMTPIKDIMSGQTLQTVSPEDDLNTALKLIAKNDINQVVIKDNGKCAGLLTRADIIRYIQMSQELGTPPPRGNGGQAA